jgi:hypothetical protein
MTRVETRVVTRVMTRVVATVSSHSPVVVALKVDSTGAKVVLG